MPDLQRIRRDRRSSNLDVLIRLRLQPTEDNWATRTYTVMGGARFTIHYQAGVATGDLIEHGGNTYRILRIAEVGRRAYLELEALRMGTATAGKGHGGAGKPAPFPSLIK